MFYLIVGSIVASLMSLAVFVYFYKQGMFSNVEETKFQVFRDQED